MKTNYQSPSLKTLLFLGALIMGCGATSIAQAQVFGITPGNVVNAGQDAGTYGFTFTPDQPLFVSQLGAFDFGSYSSGSATIELWKMGDASSLASASVSLEGGTTSSDTWMFRYAAISGVTLATGIEYALVWHDNIGQAAQPLSIPSALTAVPGSGITITHTYNHSGLAFSGNPLADGGSFGSSTPGDLQIKGSVDMTLSSAAIPESEYAIPAMAGIALLLHAYRSRSRKAGSAV